MKTKLIKLNEEDYIIVDGIEVKEGDYVLTEYNKIGKVLRVFQRGGETNYHVFVNEMTPISSTNCKKITYSTKPLEYHQIGPKTKNWFKTVFDKIKRLPLSKVEELLFGYSVEKLVDESFENMGYHSTVTPYEEDQFKLGYKLGFNAHKELPKDKLFTVDDMLRVFKHGILFNQVTSSNCKEAVETEFDLLIKSIKPKTEWEVEYINDKLTLKQ